MIRDNISDGEGESREHISEMRRGIESKEYIQKCIGEGRRRKDAVTNEEECIYADKVLQGETATYDRNSRSPNKNE